MDDYQEDDCNELAFTCHLRPINGAIKEAVQVFRSHSGTGQLQCADCFQWFSSDANHTCAAQIRRNKKTEVR